MRRAGSFSLVTMFAALAFSGCFGEAEDQDLLSKQMEEDGWVVTVIGPDGVPQTRTVTSDPSREDTDDDGLDDNIEFLERLDPRAPDTDGDGLLDGLDRVIGVTDKRYEAWMALGIKHEPDGNATRFLGERGDGITPRGGDALDADTDDDGILDGVEALGFEIEILGETRHVRTHVRFEDTDSDRLFDGVERALGLDPTQRDTDGDLVVDSADVDPYRDLRVRFRVDALAHAGAEPVYLDVFGLASRNYVTPDLEDGEGTPGEPWHESPVLDPRDDGGDILKGAHNVTFLVVALRDTNDGPVTVDLFSDTGGMPQLQARLHALTGTLMFDGADGPVAWPAEGFTGPEGSIRFTVARTLSAR